jgi:hypothetical protein
MPDVPPTHDPNRPKPRPARGASAEPEPVRERRAEINEDARRTGTAKRQDESRGGIGGRADGGYAEQVPKPAAPKR